MDGKYPTGDVDEAMIQGIVNERKIAQAALEKA